MSGQRIELEAATLTVAVDRVLDGDTVVPTLVISDSTTTVALTGDGRALFHAADRIVDAALDLVDRLRKEQP